MVTVGSWCLGMWVPNPQGYFSEPRFDTFLGMDFHGWRDQNTLGTMLIGSSMMLFMAIFDTVGVQYGLYSIAGMLKHGIVPGGWGLNVSAALGTIAGALLGTGPLVVANASSAGIMEGARTGLSAVVVSVLFLLSAFVTPILHSIPDQAAALPLILIGSFMMEPSRSIAWDNLRVAIPSFVAIVLVPHAMHNGLLVSIFVDILFGLAATSQQWCSGAWLHWCGGVVEEAELVGELLPSSCGEPESRVAAANPTLGRGPACRASSEPPVATWKSSWNTKASKHLATPHSWISPTIGLKDTDKIDRVRELLQDLGPADNILQASHTWDSLLRRALEQYLEGVATKPLGSSAGSTLPPQQQPPPPIRRQQQNNKKDQRPAAAARQAALRPVEGGRASESSSTRR